MRGTLVLFALLAMATLARAAASERDAAAAAGPAARVYRYAANGALRADSLGLRGHFPLPPARDMTLGGFGGDLLLLDPAGGLRLVVEGDSLPRRLLSSDLSARDWPEAVAADGPDWLLLVDGGQAVQRLGRRGEAKERWALPEAGLWRGLRADRGGRLWVAEPSRGRFLRLTRAGQALEAWDLERRLPGYQGPILDWCPDEQGGLYVAEGWPARLHHLNGAGNPLGSWNLGLPPGELALAVDGRDRLVVAHGPEDRELRLALQRLPVGERLLLKEAETLWLLEPVAEAP
ncbi:hypothetical protein FJ251_03470 [bacterium]|nr:hypothetical protein [bacterium]